MKKCGYRNLGCRVNACELDAMREQMEAAGFETVPFDSPADVYVIHTCTVTNIADRKSRQMIRQARRRNPDAVVAAVGCHVQGHVSELLEGGECDILIGTNRKADLAGLVLECLAGRGHAVVNDVCEDIREERVFEEQPLLYTGPRIRANLKVQDGCDRFCSYCRIPLVRGRSRSRSPEAVLDEVRRLAADGCREIVLNGIDLSSYHGRASDVDAAAARDAASDLCEAADPAEGAAVSDICAAADCAEGAAASDLCAAADCAAGADARGAEFRKIGLADLVLAAAGIEGISRIRLGSLEQGIITPVFLEKLSGCGKFCPQFHLSLQSGSDTVLARMNRHYTAGDYLEKCRLIREYFPFAAITTDVIAGFPGETRAEHEETMAFLREAGFSRIHAFPFSKREGTAAAEMDGQLTEKEKKERCHELICLGDELAARFADRFVGREAEVLVEETAADGVPEGYTREYLRACAPAGCRPNTIVSGTVRGIDSEGRLVIG